MGRFSIYSDKWFCAAEKRQQVNLRLFCFPFGGGGASFYRTWSKGLPPEVEVCAVQLPGRESRLREEPFTELLPLVTTLSEIMGTCIDIPFAFFGHSMGSLIGFELTRQLRREGKRGPVHLFVSGRRAPQIKNNDPPKHDLPKEEFIEAIRSYNGTPELILREPELLELFLPILRADFSVLETYRYTEEHPVECAITAFGGLEDRKAKYEDLRAWKDQTCDGFRVKVFPGDHFYLKDAREELLEEIAKDLRVFLYSDKNRSFVV